MQEAQTKLKRELGLVSTTLYGLGNILGAGIYALIGIVAAKAGYLTPLSFLIALVLAVFTALSYMEFSSRHPLASGEAYYIHKAFSMQSFSVLIGLMIAFAGLISSATMLRSFIGYFNIFFIVPSDILIVFVVMIIGGIAVWGISESVWIASAITLIELSGLLLVLWVSKSSLLTLPSHLPELVPPINSIEPWQGVFVGAFIAFYAFIGFEDMVTIAEEVKHPKITMPLAIFFAFIAATIIYISISLVSVLTIDPELLAYSNAPMSLVYEMSTGKEPVMITLISLFAVLNGSLVQIIKASRMLYGMSEQKWLPEIFAKVSPLTKTPIPATLTVTFIILVLALCFPLESLATATSYTVLTVFGIVNLGLLKIKITEKKSKIPVDYLSMPKLIPLLGTVFSFAIIIFKIFNP